MSRIRRDRGRRVLGGRSRPSRAELRAVSRRTRAMSHLRRVRGQVPSAAPRRAIFAIAAAVSLLAGAVFGVSVAGGASHFGGGEAALDAIWVRGASHLPAAEIARVTGVVPSAVRAEVVAAEIVERLESHAWIAKARALWLPTGALLVDVTEAVAVALVEAGSPRRTYVVDAGGTPFALAEEQHDGALPRLATGKAVAPFEPSEQIAQALELARERGAGCGAIGEVAREQRDPREVPAREQHPFLSREGSGFDGSQHGCARELDVRRFRHAGDESSHTFFARPESEGVPCRTVLPFTRHRSFRCVVAGAER